MKLSVPLTTGQVLVFEGTYEELIRVGEEFVARHGNLIATPTDVAQLQPMATINVGDGVRYWTEHTARALWTLLSGDQAKLVKYLLQRGGAAKYSDVQKQLGLGAQKLAGVLSSITRNAKKATGYREARLVNWRKTSGGDNEYYVHPTALSLLSAIAK